MPLMMSIDDTARNLSLCRASVYNLIKSGKLETVKIGKRRLVRTESIHKLVEIA